MVWGLNMWPKPKIPHLFPLELRLGVSLCKLSIEIFFGNRRSSSNLFKLTRREYLASPVTTKISHLTKLYQRNTQSPSIFGWRDTHAFSLFLFKKMGIKLRCMYVMIRKNRSQSRHGCKHRLHARDKSSNSKPYLFFTPRYVLDNLNWT